MAVNKNPTIYPPVGEPSFAAPAVNPANTGDSAKPQQYVNRNRQKPSLPAQKTRREADAHRLQRHGNPARQRNGNPRAHRDDRREHRRITDFPRHAPPFLFYHSSFLKDIFSSPLRGRSLPKEVPHARNVRMPPSPNKSDDEAPAS